MKITVSIAQIILHSIYILQILLLVFPISVTISKFILMVFFSLLFIAYIYHRQRITIWTWKGLYANGLVFICYYIFSLSLGLLYGYDSSYVLINIFLVVPTLYFIFIPKLNDADVEKLLNVVLFYVYISIFFSLLELVAWENVGFLKDRIMSSFNEKGNSVLLNNETGQIRAFGISSNAVKNGLFLIFGFVILLTRMAYRFKWRYLVNMMLIVIVIYFTHTRNNYLSLLFVLFVWFVIYYYDNYKHERVVWYITILSYVCVIGMALYLAYIEGVGSFDVDAFTSESSIQSRVISWAIIFNDYFFSHKNLFNVLFGFAQTQLNNDVSPEKTYWAIDNSIMMVYLGGGLIGIYLFITWLSTASKILYKNRQNCKGKECQHLQILITVLMVYVVNGAMNASILTYTFVLPMLILLSKYTRGKRI